ncbi:hypothetical protein CHS0354_018515 [Potamilus streckersoni]|uniref:DNA methylase N-4/N-6 domain-containing protein n=1 Tax=Potamilus streckersoni TaxID=2493646 RepID=A0AAE0TBQ2_9BIVA|nr:hypothetical protein CHS0354_018515 [Potamilus streckersoni]
MEKIIKASSNPGDVVFDAYCGCGTTIAVAERLGRNISVILKRMTDTFGKKIERKIKTEGIPRDMASARALAEKEDDRLRKEFEKWALLTYTAHKAFPNDKKGGDKGIDGTAYFENAADTPGKMVFQVKSGAVKRSDIATLKSDMVAGKSGHGSMYEEAIGAGFYSHPLMKKDYPRIRIVSIEEMIEKKRAGRNPLGISILKKHLQNPRVLQSELDME